MVKEYGRVVLVGVVLVLMGTDVVRGQVTDSVVLSAMLEKVAEVTEEDPDFIALEESAGYGWSRSLPLNWQNLLRYSRHELMLRWGRGMEVKKGYADGTYEGSMWKEAFRYTYQFSDRIQAALTGEKDAGERFFGSSQPLGMDFYAGYFALMNTGFLKKLIVGNFAASFGQGLVAGTGSPLGSVIGYQAPLRVSQGVRGSSSANECSYLRGVATSVRFGKFIVSGWFSRHHRDATITVSDSLNGEPLKISSFQSSGYHRTGSEIRNRNSVRETVYGGNVTFTGQFYRVGVTIQHAGWSASVEPEPKPYRLWSFRGREMTAAGADFIVRLKYISLFGEAATTFGGGWAWLAGVIAEPAPETRFSVTLRSYDPDYRNILSGAPGQNSLNANEQGCLINLAVQPASALSLTGYADLCRRPWLSYRVNNPSTGVEAGVLATWQGGPSWLLSGRFYYRESARQADVAGAGVPSVEPVSRLAFRLRADWHPAGNAALLTQLEFSRGLGGFDENPSGVLAGQEFRADLFKKKVLVSIRYMLFDIPEWDLRIYCYEPDITGSFSIPAYHGRGIRVSALIRGRITRYLQWWVKYGITWYEDRKVVGSGPEEIAGSNQSEIKLQVSLAL